MNCNLSVLPIISSNFLKPISAKIFLTSSAIKKKNLITSSGVPLNFFLNSGLCVAIPTGQVLRWHFLIIIQPIDIKGAVEKPNSSAPNKAPIITSFPVLRPPSTCKEILLLKLLSTKVC